MQLAIVADLGNPTESSDVGLREKLKRATSSAHRALDARLSRFDLASLEGYRRFLEANAAALLPLEAALERAGVARIFCDWPQRSRRTTILADLKHLGSRLQPEADDYLRFIDRDPMRHPVTQGFGHQGRVRPDPFRKLAIEQAAASLQRGFDIADALVHRDSNDYMARHRLASSANGLGDIVRHTDPRRALAIS